MKFKTLTLHNLASIEDATLNFEAQPLATGEVFLITGKTGSGKSTLLDAICLALYGETPRMANSQMQGELKEGKDLLKADDARLLLRKNATEGFAQLTFEGTDGRTYRAKWSIARAYKKADGRLQSPQRELENLKTGEILTKVNDIKAALTEAIGLDFAQFCRTTLLAQGEFTRFLNSKDDEKANILEKITGVDAYSRIGKKVYERTVEQKQCWEQAEQQIKGIPTLTEEEVDDRRQRSVAAEQQLQTLKQEILQLEQARQWVQTEIQLEQAQNEAAKACREVEAQVNSEDFQARETLVKQWNDTVEIRSTRWHEAQEEARRKALQDRLQQELAPRFSLLRGAQQAAETARTELQGECARHAAALHTELPLQPLYKEASAWAERLTSLADSRRKKAAAQQRRETAQQQVTQVLTPAVERAALLQAEAQRNWQDGQRHCQAEEAALEAMQLPQCRREREQLQEALLPLNAIQHRLEQWMEKTEQHQQEQTSLNERASQLVHHQQQLKTIMPKLQAALQERDTQQTLFEAQRDTVNKFAQTMRAKLQVGMECPVCRRPLTEALPSEGDIAALFALQQKAYQQAQQTYEQILNEQHQLEALILQENQAWTHDCTRWLQQSERRQTLQQWKEDVDAFFAKTTAFGQKMEKEPFLKLLRIADWMRQEKEQWNCGKWTDSARPTDGSSLTAENFLKFTEQTHPAADSDLPEVTVAQWQRAIAAAQTTLQQGLEEGSRRLQEGEKQQQQVNLLRKKVDQLQQRLAQATAAMQQAELTREQAWSKVQTEEALCQSLTDTGHSLVTTLHAQLDAWSETEKRLLTNDWNWQTEPESFAQRLLEAAQRYQQQTEQQQRREQQLKVIQDLCLQGETVLQQLIARLPHWNEREIPATPTSTNWINELHTLHTNVESTLEQGEAARQQAQTLHQQVEAFLQTHPELTEETLEALQQLPAADIRRQEALLRSLREQCIQQQTLLSAANEQLTSHHTLRPAQLEAWMTAWLPTESPTYAAFLEASQQRLQELDHLSATVAEQKGALLQELKQDKANRQKVGSLRQEAEEKEKRYQQWSRLNELIGNATGDKFRKIAQSYILSNLIRVANHYLADLTDRYTLKVEPGSFLILLEDAYQGYASRIASTLSGGESFLVSLALALALSDMGQRLKVDTLFIDEGFGTLSGEPLQQAIQTLRSLHSQSGRHVGIISHVEELRERIPVQIRVEQEGKNSSSRVRVWPETTATE